MATYSAINIGPIVKTLGLARRPRELWAASYMFSALMKRIVDMLHEENIIVISPTRIDGLLNGVGRYPDRVYFKGSIDRKKVDEVVSKFIDDLNKKCKQKIKNEYFNIMTSECSSETFENSVVETLNHDLDIQELFVKAIDAGSENAIFEMMSLNGKSPLLEEGEKEKKIRDLEYIAKHELDGTKSYCKYFCVVQADGDNMGKSIMSADQDELTRISSEMLQFGRDASEAITKFSKGSLPLYAGGDDLLFIVPVIGSDNRNVFDLIEDIDKVFKDTVQVEVPKASMSYGISINYYKYPLYEVLESARNQLFEVAKKKVPGKNAVAVDFRKHSGGSFAFACSKSNLIYDCFKEVIIKSGVEQSVVSAVAHKIRNNKDLLGLWFESDNYEDRNSNFFKKFIEYKDASDKNQESAYKKQKQSAENAYKEVVLELLNAYYKYRDDVEAFNKDKDESEKIKYDIDVLTKNVYAMLRTAKFIKGEPIHE